MKRPSRRKWSKVRLAVLDRDSWCCQKCGNYGNEADHIKRIIDGGPVWEMGNIQTLCRDCHIAKSADEKRGGPVDPEVQKWQRYLTSFLSLCIV